MPALIFQPKMRTDKIILFKCGSFSASKMSDWAYVRV